MRVLNPWTQRLLTAKPRGKPPASSFHGGGQEVIRKEYPEMDRWSDREVILEDETM